MHAKLRQDNFLRMAKWTTLQAQGALDSNSASCLRLRKIAVALTTTPPQPQTNYK